jgi:hypothetical protein
MMVGPGRNTGRWLPAAGSRAGFGAEPDVVWDTRGSRTLVFN